ncbi:MAG TPA: hypothetical protein VGK89_12980 [Candidatus Eisenbacteria bacterium]|jgi:hypothetical protein
MRSTARAAHILAATARAVPPLACAALLFAAAFSTFAASRTGASPAPSLRSLAPRARARLAAEPEGRGRVSRCGTRLESAVELLAEHNARALGDPLPTPHSTDAGEIAVLEDDGTFFYTNKGNDTILDVYTAARAFYRTHGDDYDFLALYLASGLHTYLGSPGALASAFVVRNATLGIGLDVYDIGGALGSPARLQSVLSMNGLHDYVSNPDSGTGLDQFSPLDLLAHELGHRWLSYVYVDSAGTPVPALLGRGYQHWGFFFDCDASVMEGCGWMSPGPDSFRTDSVTVGYGTLDRYLMGLASKADTPPFFVVNDPTALDPPGTYVPSSIAFVGLGCRGRATWWQVSDIEAVHGPRVPDAASAPHSFRLGIALVTAHGSGASAADLAKLEGIRSRFTPYFAAATRYLGTVDCTLDSRAGRVCIAHQALPDLEIAAASRNVGARAYISQAGIPIALDPASVRLFWHAAGGGAWNEVPMSPAGGDSFAATFPPVGAIGDYEYYLHAASDSSGIDADEPAAGPAAPHLFHAGPDLTPPAIAHVPVHAQGKARMPQTLIARVTDNLGVDSVWVEYRVNGGATLTSAVTPAGRDSFRASLGAGLDSGSTVAYRFVARDRAAAGNVAYSSATPETIHVGRDWTLDFENGGDGMTHALYYWSYRDAWHLSQLSSSPPGGTAWLCGSDSTDYPVHLDANLYLPAITDLVPGTHLRFDHRYGLENLDETYAWDGARLEISVAGGAWQVLTPVAGYSHVFYVNSNPFQRNTPCWSGESGGWRGESVDLSPYAPGPVTVRFRMLADDFEGGLGWLVDHVRVTYPGATTSAPSSATALAIGLPRPNPARGLVRQSVALARTARGEWSLYDLAGRRVATLWRGAIPAGGLELTGSVPAALPNGLYFTRLALDGREVRADRVAVIR